MPAPSPTTIAPYIALSDRQILLCTLLMALNWGVSLYCKLGLERSLFIATVRTIVQLWLIGIILEWVFHQKNLGTILLILMLMTGVAGFSSVGRIKNRYKGIYPNNLLAIILSVWPVVFFTMALLDVRPWFTPQYMVPFLGLILGNSLNGISIGVDRFTQDISGRRMEILTALSLGARSLEAIYPMFREAARASIIPILNSMMVVGVVSLPGMMTGQLLAGIGPQESVRYQILLMFVIATSSLWGGLFGIYFCYRQLFNEKHQFSSERLTT